MSTLIQQIATKKSLVESIAKANKEAQAKSSIAMMDAAVLRQKEIANASGSYSYSGSSYGSFVDESLLALEAATLVNSDKKQSTSYSYSGSSYGTFIPKNEPSVLDMGHKSPTNTEDAPSANEQQGKKQSFFEKHKYMVLAVVGAIVGYFVFRKK